MSRPNDGGSLDDPDIRLFESGNFADATIVCGDRTWKVHKLILSSRCKWFKAAFYGNMAEAESGTIVLQEQEAEFVEVMLRFIYAKDPDILALRDGKDIPLAVLCVELFRLADFFLLDKLAEAAKYELAAHLRVHMAVQDKDKALFPDTLKQVLESIRCAYRDESTEPIRQVLLNFMFLRKDRHLQAPETIALLDEIPEVGRDLMKTFLSINLTTNEPNANELPRALPVVEAVYADRLVYVAGGPILKFKHGSRPLNSPCVLIPQFDTVKHHEPLFKVRDAETATSLIGMGWLVPHTGSFLTIARNEDSSIVQIFPPPRSPLLAEFSTCIRFLCPADAKHYVSRYRRARPEIQELEKSAVELEQELRTAHYRATKDTQVEHRGSAVFPRE
ncbi:hypothetical protein KVR01_011998 [Diaporthe batatas]|uniref:uncharacterized protein n=1 Tax=Diaporthe batatas TaxID=748121 RepID=UPI001D03C37B|nr:uncharacterized protein KVR01_011998 [Diaporthe batatas]KAG8158237.1 hypothetical protein KVR01_011998 [Diaporthe batatas]